MKSQMARTRVNGAPSLPVRGAWVEITGGKVVAESYIVAPRAGSVG